MRFCCSLCFILVALSTVARVSFVDAAEDDRIVDGSTVMAAVPAQRVRVVRLVDVSPEDIAAQRLAQRDHQLMVFLDKINTECALTDEQMQKAKLAGKQDVRRPVTRGEFQSLTGSPSTLFGTDFITTDSMVYKFLMTQLREEQRQKFEALRDREMKAKIFKSLK